MFAFVRFGVAQFPDQYVFRPKVCVCVWHKSRKDINRLMHIIHGNTISERTPWESSPDREGIQVFNIDELKLSGDKSGQVCEQTRFAMVRLDTRSVTPSCCNLKSEFEVDARKHDNF